MDAVENWLGRSPVSGCFVMDIGTDIIDEWIKFGLNNFELHLHKNGFKLPHNREAEYIVIQYWAESSSRNSEGYVELTTPEQVFSLVCLDHKHEALIRERISSYRSQAVAHIYRVQEEEEEVVEEDGEELPTVLGRVFRGKRAEESPNISHYTTHEYPLRDFALNCGILASLCLPLFLMSSFSGNPDGVVEILFTSHAALHFFKRVIYKKYCSDANTILTPLTLRERMQVCRYGAFPNDMPPDAPEEIKHVLTAVCQTHNLPLAQSWFILRDGFRGFLVTDHATSLDLRESMHWREFKEASSIFCSYVGDGLVSKTFQSHKSYFCKDITELNITNYPLVHYVRNCGSVSCVTIYLHSFTQGYKDFVLEFFVPHVEVDISYPQNVLNSLFATLKEYLRVYTVGFGEQELFVEVINSSMHSETKYFKIGHHPVIYLPHNEGSQKERGSVPQRPLNRQFMAEDGEQRDENVLDVEETYSTISEISRTHEESVVEDVGDAINTKSQPFMTKKLLPRVQGTYIEEEIVVLVPSNQQPRLQDSTQNKAIIVGAEKDETTIHSINPTCIEGTPKGEKKSETDISYESLSEHFGTPLDAAAKSFRVSRSTFKRICRKRGIERWQSDKRRVGKRRVGGDISKVGRINDDMDKMTVKATYKFVTIIFDLLNSSGMTDLEDNVIERLHLERKKFTMEYQDGDGDWILIACDKDVHKCMEISRSLKKTTIKILIDRPIHHYAP